MKSFRKTNVFKSLFSMALVVLMVLPTNAFAATTIRGQALTDSKTLELIQMFPSFKTSLEENTNGKLISSNDTYIKYTPKSTENSKKVYTDITDIKKDFEIQEYTKDQYKKEISQVSLDSLIAQTSIIGSQEEVPCYWLNMSLQVYAGTTSGKFMAYNFSSWKTVPNFRFQDAVGLSFTSGLIASQDSNSRHAEYNHNVFPNGDYTETLPVDINPGIANGVMAKFNLGNNTTLSLYPTYDNTMISTGVELSGSGTTSGWISANYLHKQVSLGSINMDAAGIPSVSLSISHDEHHASVYVAK